ncbi:ABC transporter permease [Humibacter ginsenosidimutans]|uniref:ABC transporter permease n=1 Tax=Humibacter ginsenosidimutans TaxID=2599293 RepID=A0A5B8M009_9MICO|nr:ABC transporter permease [Humibacter ginsenosidimutans]QDZ13977.1 ABC transporter permease [Humibacter ginsenosidimutans]
MTAWYQTFAWLADPANWAGPGGIPARLGEHVVYSLVTLIVAVAIAVPIGVIIGHTGKGRAVAVQLSGALRALPTLGVVLLLALWLGTGLGPPLVALVVLALPPLLAGAYAGVSAVDRQTIDAARGIGMTETQVLFKVELPLAMPIIIGGIRSGALQVIATWTVAAYLPVGGLGRFIYDGYAVQNYAEMLGASVLVIVLALVADGVFALIQRLVVPRGVVVGRASDVRVRSSKRLATTSQSTTAG